MSKTRVVDVRDAEDARPGQQQQTVEQANATLERIDGATMHAAGNTLVAAMAEQARRYQARGRA